MVCIIEPCWGRRRWQLILVVVPKALFSTSGWSFLQPIPIESTALTTLRVRVAFILCMHLPHASLNLPLKHQHPLLKQHRGHVLNDMTHAGMNTMTALCCQAG